MTGQEKELSEASTDSLWYSARFGKINFRAVVGKCAEKIITEDTTEQFKIIIGTDSKPNHKVCEFVTAIILYRVGHGGSYFWQRVVTPYNMANMHRVRTEAWLSLFAAQKLVTEFAQYGLLDMNLLEIHVDIGQKGDTRELIHEVTGMIRANGFEYKIKPDAYAAQTVADRHT